MAHERAANVLIADKTIQQRVDFYQEVVHRSANRKSLTDQLSRLPAGYIAPLLQAITQTTMFLAGVPDPSVKTPGMRLRELMRQSGKPAKVLLYGAGRHTSRLLAEKHLWESEGHQVVGLIDDHPRFKESPTHLSLPVESVASVESRAPLGNLMVVLSTDTFQEQFWNQTAGLRKRGIPVFRLYPEALKA